MKFLRGLLGLDKEATVESAGPDEDRPTTVIFVTIPEDLMPIDRGDKYEDPIDAAMTKAGLGFVSGGGTEMGTDPDDGSMTIAAMGVDVDVYDKQKALPFLRNTLVELGCPADTKLQYLVADVSIEEIFDGQSWHHETRH